MSGFNDIYRSDPDKTRLVGIIYYNNVLLKDESILIQNDSDSNKESDKFLDMFSEELLNYSTAETNCRMSLLFTGDSNYKISECNLYLVNLLATGRTREDLVVRVGLINANFRLSKVNDLDVPAICVTKIETDDYIGFEIKLRVSSFPKYEKSILIPIKFKTECRKTIRNLTYRCLWELSKAELANQKFIMSDQFGGSEFKTFINFSSGTIIQRNGTNSFSGSIEDGLKFLSEFESKLETH